MGTAYRLEVEVHPERSAAGHCKGAVSFEPPIKDADLLTAIGNIAQDRVARTFPLSRVAAGETSIKFTDVHTECPVPRDDRRRRDEHNADVAQILRVAVGRAMTAVGFDVDPFTKEAIARHS